MTLRSGLIGGAVVCGFQYDGKQYVVPEALRGF
jgi:hypothetical protein